MADLVTPKQLVAIRAIANTTNGNAEALCLEFYQCKPEELSRRAASVFIDYLKIRSADGGELVEMPFGGTLYQVTGSQLEQLHAAAATIVAITGQIEQQNRKGNAHADTTALATSRAS